MNIVFMGTSDFAVPALRALASNSPWNVTLVLTRPDAASGRGKALIPSPVRQCAEELSIPVITPQGRGTGFGVPSFSQTEKMSQRDGPFGTFDVPKGPSLWDISCKL